MKYQLIIILTAFVLASLDSNAQTVEGFWSVNNVTVGTQNVTPVAKWFVYEKDQTYRAGNGWTQNDIGTWTYDKKKEEFLPTSKIGAPDEYGAFKVRFTKNKMFWEREEDGMPVVVSLSRIREMPMAPADRIPGHWNLQTIKKDTSDLTEKYDPDDVQFLDIRRGQTYKMTNPDRSESLGFWHMDAHSPEFHLIDFNREVDFKVFTVSFKENLLIMRSKKEDGLIYIYKRI